EQTLELRQARPALRAAFEIRLCGGESIGIVVGQTRGEVGNLALGDVPATAHDPASRREPVRRRRAGREEEATERSDGLVAHQPVFEPCGRLYVARESHGIEVSVAQTHAAAHAAPRIVVAE